MSGGEVATVPRYVVPVAHRPNRDGSVPAGAHVPFYLALEVASDAWLAALAEFCAPELTPMELAMVHTDSDFRRELFTGELTVDVTVERIGRTSVTVELELFQSGVDAATVTLVLARVDEGRVRAVPLTAEQRAVLQALAPAPAVVD